MLASDFDFFGTWVAGALEDVRRFGAAPDLLRLETLKLGGLFCAIIGPLDVLDPFQGSLLSPKSVFSFFVSSALSSSCSSSASHNTHPKTECSSYFLFACFSSNFFCVSYASKQGCISARQAAGGARGFIIVVVGPIAWSEVAAYPGITVIAIGVP